MRRVPFITSTLFLVVGALLAIACNSTHSSKPSPNDSLDCRSIRGLGPVVEYDYTNYCDQLSTAVQSEWDIPEIARHGIPGVSSILVVISGDGSLLCLDITSDSGTPPLDFAARDAVIRGVPTVQVPLDAPVGGGLVVMLDFFYNIDPPEERPLCVRGVMPNVDS